MNYLSTQSLFNSKMFKIFVSGLLLTISILLVSFAYKNYPTAASYKPYSESAIRQSYSYVFSINALEISYNRPQNEYILKNSNNKKIVISDPDNKLGKFMNAIGYLVPFDESNEIYKLQYFKSCNFIELRLDDNTEDSFSKDLLGFKCI